MPASLGIHATNVCGEDSPQPDSLMPSDTPHPAASACWRLVQSLQKPKPLSWRPATVCGSPKDSPSEPADPWFRRNLIEPQLGDLVDQMNHGP